MAGPIVPATGIIESRHFAFMDDDAAYELTLMRFDNGDIELCAEVKAGEAKAAPIYLTFSVDQVYVIAGALLDLASISHVESRHIDFMGAGAQVHVGITRKTGEVMGLHMRRADNSECSAFVPLTPSYARMIGHALQDMAHYVREATQCQTAF